MVQLEPEKVSKECVNTNERGMFQIVILLSNSFQEFLGTKWTNIFPYNAKMFT
jgi:hypothetical protein